MVASIQLFLMYLNRFKFCFFICLVFFGSCQNLVFNNTDTHYGYPDDPVETQNIFLRGESGNRIHLWSVSLPQTKTNSWVLYLHGNSKNMSFYHTQADWLLQHGYRILMLDYQGFGQSEGRARFPNLFGDVYQSLDYLQKAIQPDELIIFAQSMGAAALWGGLERYQKKGTTALPIKAILLEGAFYSLQETAAEVMKQNQLTAWFTFLARLLIPDQYSPRYTLDELALDDIPIMQVHSRRDPLVHFTQAQKLADALPYESCKLFVSEMTHVDISLIKNGKYQASILNFLKSQKCP